jgi:cytochrome c-type biogenesis protein CcmH
MLMIRTFVARRVALRHSLTAIAILTTSALVSPVALAQETASTPRAKALSMRVKCMCGGCNDPAGGCYHSGGAFSGPCASALAMIKEINQKIAKGEPDDAILKDFVAEYGSTVLVDPPKSGFNLTAWIMPVLVPLVAVFAVWEVLRQWRRRARQNPAPAPNVPPDVLARVRHEAEKEEL